MRKIPVQHTMANIAPIAKRSAICAPLFLSRAQPSSDTMRPMMPQPAPRRALPSLWFVGLALSLVLPLSAAAQTPDTDDGPKQQADVSRVHLTGNDDIVRMAKAGLGDDLLIQTIQVKPGHYETNPDDLISLKSAGLSDRVIAAMQAHGTTSTTSGRTLLSGNKPGEIATMPLAAGVDEIGVYYKDKNGEFVPLKTERVDFKSGGAVKTILTHGIISKDLNGHLDGTKSPLNLFAGTQIVIYAPLGTDAAEYTFIQFRQHEKDREFRVNTGGVFHSETGAQRDSIPFEAKKIAPQMYTFNLPADLVVGEYGVLPPGSSNTQGIAGTGKIFTFSIPE
jgi:hypothetical protein